MTVDETSQARLRIVVDGMAGRCSAAPQQYFVFVSAGVFDMHVWTAFSVTPREDV